MSIGIFELVNGVLTKKKIAGKTLMDAQLNANSRNGVQNRIITGEINDIKDDISTINTHLSKCTQFINNVEITGTSLTEFLSHIINYVMANYVDGDAYQLSGAWPGHQYFYAHGAWVNDDILIEVSSGGDVYHILYRPTTSYKKMYRLNSTEI